MNHAPGLSHRHDILSEYAESGLPSVEAFAQELGVSQEWVRYWLELAELKRRQHADGHRCD